MLPYRRIAIDKSQVRRRRLRDPLDMEAFMENGAVLQPALDLAQKSKNTLREDGRLDDGNGG